MATAQLAAAGARVITEPADTPWRPPNSPPEASTGLQLTLFEAPEPE